MLSIDAGTAESTLGGLMNPQDNNPLSQDSDTLRYEKEIHAMVPELNRPFKLESAQLTNSLLKTTFEEFIILYDVEARFRQGYSESETLVNIPNLFVKVFTDSRSKAHYLKTLSRPDSVGFLRTGFNSPLYQRAYGNPVDFTGCFSGGQLNRDVLKASPSYGLGALKVSYQSVWLDKLEFILINRTKLFTPAFDLTSGEIIETIIRIRPAVIELYNWFDFQGPIPKLLVDDSTRPYDPREAMRASLILLFLALCDLDVVVFNDAGSATFENYLQDASYHCFYPDSVPQTQDPTRRSQPGITLLIGALILLAVFILYRLLF